MVMQALSPNPEIAEEGSPRAADKELSPNPEAAQEDSAGTADEAQ